MIRRDRDGYYSCEVCGDKERIRLLTPDKDLEKDLRLRFELRHRHDRRLRRAD